MLPRQGTGPTLLNAIASKGQGQLSNSHDLGASSITVGGEGKSWGRASPPCPLHFMADEWRGQVTLTDAHGNGSSVPLPPGQLYCAAQVKGRAHSPSQVRGMAPSPALPTLPSSLHTASGEEG